jgi:hypothetical protein
MLLIHVSTALLELSTVRIRDTESIVAGNAKKAHITPTQDLIPKWSAHSAPKASFIASQGSRVLTGAKNALASNT